MSMKNGSFNNGSPEYVAYMNSPKWKKLRTLILQRDRNLCRGCLLQPATEVHHLTYEHVYNELAFELISLCDDCHDRAHGRQVGKRKKAPSAIMRALEHLEAGVKAQEKRENPPEHRANLSVISEFKS